MDSKAVGVLEDLKKIAAQEGGFSFGELWRYDKDSITAVLPIIHSNGLERGYVTSAEAGKSLVITDTGSIDAVKLENKADQAVLIRKSVALTRESAEEREWDEIQRYQDQHGGRPPKYNKPKTY